MTTAIQKSTAQSPPANAKPSALALMAARLSVEPAKMLETLKDTVFKGASNNELMALVVVANEYGLNPFLKELYAFPAKGGGIVPIVSVDGWNKMLIRQPDFDGIEFEMVDDADGKPHSCTATIHIKGRSHAVKVTEYFDECFRQTDPWKNMPRRMLRNRTLCQASRLAFGFSGVHNDDEAAAITVESTIVAMPAEPPPKMVTAPEGKTITPQMELEAVVLEAGHDFSTLQKWGEETGIIPNADSIGAFSEITTDTAKQVLRIPRKAFLDALNKIKAVVGKGGLL